MKRVLILLIAAWSLLGAAAVPTKYAVILGTYTDEANADRELKRLETLFAANAKMVQLQEENGFDYVSEPFETYHVVAIKPIVGREAMDEVFAAAREVFSDAYVSRASSYYSLHYHPEGEMPVPKIEEAAEQNLFPPKAKDSDALKAEAIRRAEVKEQGIQQPPVTESAPAAQPVAAPAPKPAPKPIPKPVPAPETGGMGMDDMLLYGGAGGVIVLLVVVMIVMRRKKKPLRPLESLDMSDDREADVPPAAEEVSTQEPETPAETEAPEISVTEPVDEVAPETAEAEAEAEEATELPEAVEAVEETVSASEGDATEAEPEPEVAETVAAAEPEPTDLAASGLVSHRQKRAYKSQGEPISKESFTLFAGSRILVAEDNMINQKVINGLLADSGIEIVIANDGQEAVNTLSQDQNFAMVLMDAHMPIMDGFEATEAIRGNAQFDDIPVIALSGDTSADDIRKMTEAGMEAHLEKPLQLPALYEVLYNYCDFEVEEESDELADVELLPDTPELHAEKGLDISMGDEELYREILNEFVDMYGDSDEKIHECIVQERMDEGASLLLDVKGIAANIGADILAEAAERLREAFLNRDEPAYMERSEAYARHLKAVLRDIEHV